ncbi:MAG: prenyltransferase/squalene oxidase repeat-containing protein, partial [Emergencia sp.]
WGCQGSDETGRVLEKTCRNLYETVQSPVTGSTGGEWLIIGLARSGFNTDEEYYDIYLENTEDYVRSLDGVLHTKTGYKYTDYARVILGFTAAGGDVTDIGGYNFLEKLTDMENICRQGINGPVWTLIAYDCGSYEIPADSGAKEQTTREKLIRAILDDQLPDGGWDIAGSAADPDMTAMALQALAPYYTGAAPKQDQVSGSLMTEIRSAVDRGLDCLSALQLADGGFSSMDTEASESCSQVIVALTALGIDPSADERFIRDASVTDALLGFYDGEGGFCHNPGDDSASQMSTEQACYALAALERFRTEKSTLYDMTD